MHHIRFEARGDVVRNHDGELAAVILEKSEVLGPVFEEAPALLQFAETVAAHPAEFSTLQEFCEMARDAASKLPCDLKSIANAQYRRSGAYVITDSGEKIAQVYGQYALQVGALFALAPALAVFARDAAEAVNWGELGDVDEWSARAAQILRSAPPSLGVRLPRSENEAPAAGLRV